MKPFIQDQLAAPQGTVTVVSDSASSKSGAGQSSLRKHGLGALFEAKITRNKQSEEIVAVCREIQFQRIKMYNVEDFVKEICQV